MQLYATVANETRVLVAPLRAGRVIQSEREGDIHETSITTRRRRIAIHVLLFARRHHHRIVPQDDVCRCRCHGAPFAKCSLTGKLSTVESFHRMSRQTLAFTGSRRRTQLPSKSACRRDGSKSSECLHKLMPAGCDQVVPEVVAERITFHAGRHRSQQCRNLQESTPCK